MINQTIAKWHTVIDEKKPELLDELLADDCVFYSPALFKPQHGKEITKFYLTAAASVLFGGGDFKYTKEILGEKHAVLEFEAGVEGVQINGVDIISINPEGKIIEFKVMVRPFSALEKLKNLMVAAMGS